MLCHLALISKFWIYTKEMFSKVFFSNPNMTGVKFTVQKVRITGILEFFTKKELGFPIMQLKIFLGDFCINQLGFGKFSDFFTFKSLIFRVCILFLSFFGNHWVFLFCRIFLFFQSFPRLNLKCGRNTFSQGSKGIFHRFLQAPKILFTNVFS